MGAEGMSDSQVDDLVRNIVQRHPHAGFRMVQAYLLAEGYRQPVLGLLSNALTPLELQ